MTGCAALFTCENRGRAGGVHGPLPSKIRSLCSWARELSRERDACCRLRTQGGRFASMCLVMVFANLPPPQVQGNEGISETD
jgi:hypothetical protein